MRSPSSFVHSVGSLLKQVPRRRLALLFILMVATALTEGVGIVMFVPLLIAFEAGTAPPGAAFFSSFGLGSGLAVLLMAFVALVAIRTLLTSALSLYRVRLHQDIIDQLRSRCYAGLVAADWRWTSAQHAGDHNAILMSRIGLVGVGFDQAIALLATVITMLIYSAAAFYLSWPTTMFALAACGAALLAFRGLRRDAVLAGQQISHANRDLYRQLHQGMPSIRLAKLLGNEGVLVSRFQIASGAMRDAKLAYSRGAVRSQALVQIGVSLLLALTAYLGIAHWQLALPVLIPLLLIFIRMAQMLGVLQQGLSQLLQALPALSDVRDLIRQADEHQEPHTRQGEALPLRQAIELADVSFTYAARQSPALDRVSLTIPVNKITAIFGESGSGKSTLADLVMGLIKPDGGIIRLDGVELTDEMRLRWRSMVTYVDQTPFLFHDSIRANLLWGKPDATDDDMIDALRNASADFVLSLPEGLESLVGDGGIKLSGGERQRIVLARALLRKPSLLILDEATSALDPENEAAIYRAMLELRGKVTILMVTHQASAREFADMQFELKQGRTVSGATTARPP
jgi:ATP-binding cassette, subfamily C, bacterial